MPKSFFATLMFSAVAVIANAADAPDRVREFVEPYLKEKQIPGCAIMVRKDGKTVHCAGYGIANLEHNVPVTTETVFQSGSIGKQFTAMAIMLLVKDGKLALDDAVSKYLNVPKTWSDITVRHVLNHTSGLGDYPETFSLQRDYSEDELLKMVVAQPLSFEPGSKWEYSNLGYVTLGILIHKVSGQSYGDFLKKQIFWPLGMKNSRIISEEQIIPHRAAGYRLKNGALKNQEWVAPSVNTTADGSLYLTAEDIAKWDQALEEEKLISHDAYVEMWNSVKLNDGGAAPYSFGWGITQTRSGHRLLEHGGAWQGFAAYIARYPDDHLSVAVFCNRAGASPRYVGQRVAALFVPELAPAVHSAAQLSKTTLESYASDYRMGDRFTIHVNAVGDHLETTWLGEKIIMMPESESAFYEPDSDRTFRVVKDNRGNVTALIISVPEELTLRRIQAGPVKTER
ncbi:MAG TPA: serine hydrolase domain-containing protein [Verrucomicrobiae bacterium]|nr:serine hydrolase domain-containing protein [Verrucomicrobiae bacterium]